MRIIEAREVYENLSMKKCIDLMEKTLADLSGGKYIQPVRTIFHLPNNNAFGFMPAYLGDRDYFGAKIITAFHSNQGTEYPSHMGYVILFEAAHGSPVALVDATSITQIRTGAVSGAATRLLARQNAHSLALIGAGAQAHSHLEAMAIVRDIHNVKVYDIDPYRAEIFAREMENKFPFPITPCSSVSEAVRNADIICTVTPSTEPFLYKDMVSPGAHINAVGTFSPDKRELGSDLVAGSKFYADQVEAMLKECGEFLIPEREGLIDKTHIQGSVGDIFLGRIKGRERDDEITVFDALGLASEDVACAKFLYLSGAPL